MLDRFPDAKAIATPKSVELIKQHRSGIGAILRQTLFPGQFPTKITAPEPYDDDTFTVEGHEIRIIEQGHDRHHRQHVAARSVDRSGRGRRRALQPLPHVRRRHHP